MSSSDKNGVHQKQDADFDVSSMLETYEEKPIEKIDESQLQKPEPKPTPGPAGNLQKHGIFKSHARAAGL